MWKSRFCHTERSQHSGNISEDVPNSQLLQHISPHRTASARRSEDIPKIRLENSSDILSPDDIYVFGNSDLHLIADWEDVTPKYDVTYKDSLGNTLSEKPTNIGEYFVIITCKNGYTGKGMSKFEITN